ncbi:hypothetical protein ACFWG0_10275 [Streptomyces yangpuensis]|uniref:hypothetical protein n=1 Tax=Streptomyces yangpuensis TaxID=1648182 RepID=UPI00366865DB
MGALVLSITTSCEQNSLSETQSKFDEEQTRLAKEQNLIAAKQQELTAREATPSAVNWGWIDVQGETDGIERITLLVENREKESVTDVMLSLHANRSESSKIVGKYKFDFLNPCTREQISVKRELLLDEDGFSFTLTFRDFTDQYWIRGSGKIKKTGKFESSAPEVEFIPLVTDKIC